MNEIDFRIWLNNQGVTKKVAGDYISRLKAIEQTIRSDLDDNYTVDRAFCQAISDNS